MMEPQMPPSNEDRPGDELSPSLRKAVERVRQSSPSDEVMSRALDQARFRLANEVEQPAVRRPSKYSRRWLLAVAAAAIAGAVVLLRFPSGINPQREVVRPERPIRPAEEGRTEPIEELPTLWAYHLSAQRSPEDLDDLLAAHADRYSVSRPDSIMSISPFGIQKEVL